MSIIAASAWAASRDVYFYPFASEFSYPCKYLVYLPEPVSLLSFFARVFSLPVSPLS